MSTKSRNPEDPPIGPVKWEYGTVSTTGKPCVYGTAPGFDYLYSVMSGYLTTHGKRLTSTTFRLEDDPPGWGWRVENERTDSLPKLMDWIGSLSMQVLKARSWRDRLNPPAFVKS
jgi:hypothetical protein